MKEIAEMLRESEWLRATLTIRAWKDRRYSQDSAAISLRHYALLCRMIEGVSWEAHGFRANYVLNLEFVYLERG